MAALATGFSHRSDRTIKISAVSLGCSKQIDPSLDAFPDNGLNIVRHRLFIDGAHLQSEKLRVVSQRRKDVHHGLLIVRQQRRPEGGLQLLPAV